ncbi:hypothetical protein [Dyadobacter frigoris]|uniref:Uncharacterized protein n=1 Tax=Dyadobacter frigoris TaxID=2576211 RepID=A0A4U6CTQ4_9BACT|nr:hypothetical protein [Dyadobacter frigoris]TKT88039.1 hypothetical protein FDK13_28475 [Dyadobacter frigoris]GLU52938.1 hypothetical protein Dfri01_23990 [Dyadobacter frigoris]
MSLDKHSLESEIIEAVVLKLGASRELSEKARNRIAKSAGKLAEKLIIIFEKQQRKAEKKANEVTEEQQDPKEEDDEKNED